jgi:hypothetical protein
MDPANIDLRANIDPAHTDPADMKPSNIDLLANMELLDVVAVNRAQAGTTIESANMRVESAIQNMLANIASGTQDCLANINSGTQDLLYSMSYTDSISTIQCLPADIKSSNEDLAIDAISTIQCLQANIKSSNEYLDSVASSIERMLALVESTKSSHQRLVDSIDSTIQPILARAMIESSKQRPRANLKQTSRRPPPCNIDWLANIDPDLDARSKELLTNTDLDDRIQDLLATVDSIQSDIQRTLARTGSSKAANQGTLARTETTLQLVQAYRKSKNEEPIDSTIRPPNPATLRLLAHLEQTSTQQTSRKHRPSKHRPSKQAVVDPAHIKKTSTQQTSKHRPSKHRTMDPANIMPSCTRSGLR